MIGLHEAEYALDAVVDVAVGPGLVPVAPHLNFAAAAGEGDLAGNRGRRLLATAIIRPQRAEDVVEADHPRLEAVLLEIVPALPLREQLLPPVTVLRIRRIRML